jgi:hypothetical protein
MSFLRTNDTFFCRVMAQLKQTLQHCYSYWQQQQMVCTRELRLKDILLHTEIDGTDVVAKQLFVSSPEHMAEQADIVIDCRCGVRATTFRETIEHFLTLCQQRKDTNYDLAHNDITVIGYGPSTQAILPLFIAMGFRITVVTNGAIIKDFEALCFGTETFWAVARNWINTGHLIVRQHTPENIIHDIISNSSNILFLNGRLPLPLAAVKTRSEHPVITIEPRGTCDQAILNTLRTLRSHPTTRHLVKQHVTFLGVRTFWDDKPNALFLKTNEGKQLWDAFIPWYGLPSFGYAGSLSFLPASNPDNTATVLLENFVPSSLLQPMNSFLGFDRNMLSSWYIKALILDDKIQLVWGTLFTPRLLDLIHPYLNIDGTDLFTKLISTPLNRGSWDTNLIRVLCQMCLFKCQNRRNPTTKPCIESIPEKTRPRSCSLRVVDIKKKKGCIEM